jgi:NAD(P)-dependent dehydrogenase (short-subunit alcohol dehydrogenase family)
MNSGKLVTIVTGGSSGLGAETVKHLAARGYIVLSCDIATPTWTPIDHTMRHFKCDVADDAALEGVFKEATSIGELSVVVSCAGQLHSELIYNDDEETTHSLETFCELINTNLIGTFNVIRYATRYMCEKPLPVDGDRGVVILTSSIAGSDGQIGQLAYAASKAAIAGMTLPAARELARHGIRIVTIAPGIFDTGMVREMPNQVIRSLERQIVYPGRFGQVSEFASLVEEIIRNRYLNGSVLRLDAATRLGCG